MTPALSTLLDELGITVVPLPKYRGPMDTVAVASLERILMNRGRDHLKMVLMSIVETGEGNNRQLIAPVIWAMSDVIHAHPGWASRASEWFAALDGISLKDLRGLAYANRGATRPRHAIATLLFERIRNTFVKPEARRQVNVVASDRESQVR